MSKFSEDEQNKATNLQVEFYYEQIKAKVPEKIKEIYECYRARELYKAKQLLNSLKRPFSEISMLEVTTPSLKLKGLNEILELIEKTKKLNVSLAEYYEILGVPINFTEKQLKRAYHKIALDTCLPARILKFRLKITISLSRDLDIFPQKS